MKNILNKIKSTIISMFHSKIFKSIMLVLISTIFLYLVIEVMNGSSLYFIFYILKKSFFSFSFLQFLYIFHYFFWSRIVSNLILIIAIILLVYGLIGRLRLSIGISSILLFLFGLINYVLINIRATPFMPSDIFSISLAAKMVGNFQFPICSALIIAFVILLLLFILLYKIKKLVVSKATSLVLRLVSIFLSSIIFVLFFTTDIFSLTMDYNTMASYQNYGLLASFFSIAKSMHITEPVGYSINSINSFVDENINKDMTVTTSSESPNIIAIMNESLADLGEVYNLNLSEDNMPFIHSLKENSIIGRAHSSSLGCKTANCEFEFLTRKFY